MNLTIPQAGEASFPFPLNGRLLSLDKDVPDVRYHGNIIFMVDANGNVRVDILCRRINL